MSQQAPLQRCAHCGANLSLDDLRGTTCRYCGTVLPHHARAAEHAAVVNQVLNQQFQARGLAPASPVVPYQYGAPPAPHGAMPAVVAHNIDQSVRRSMATILIVVGVIGVVTMIVAGVIVWLLVIA